MAYVACAKGVLRGLDGNPPLETEFRDKASVRIRLFLNSPIKIVHTCAHYSNKKAYLTLREARDVTAVRL